MKITSELGTLPNAPASSIILKYRDLTVLQRDWDYQQHQCEQEDAAEPPSKRRKVKEKRAIHLNDLMQNI